MSEPHFSYAHVRVRTTPSRINSYFGKISVDFEDPFLTVDVHWKSEWIICEWSSCKESVELVLDDGAAWTVNSEGQWVYVGSVSSGPVYESFSYPLGWWKDGPPTFTSNINPMLEYQKYLPTAYVTESDSGVMGAINSLREAIPDLSLEVPCPIGYCLTSATGDIWNMVQHLNDIHKMSREYIADWLDTLDVDLSFPVPEDIPKEPGEE